MEKRGQQNFASDHSSNTVRWKRERLNDKWSKLDSLKDNRRTFIVEIDFANFFNNISHKLLLKLLGMRIKDRRLLNLIEKFLKVGILDHSGFTAISMVGTPQGSVMSPILANVYLHYALDSWFIEKYASYYNIIVRYADDAVFLFHKHDIAMKFMEDLVNNFNLSLNMHKTTISNMNKNKNKNFAFLGFTFYWGRKYTLTRKVLKVKTQKKTLHKKIQEFKIWIKQIRNILKTKEKFYVYNPLPKPPAMTRLKPLEWCPYV